MISVILPIYNGEAFLLPTLKSIFAQTFSDFEVIAVNDGSKDQSLALLKTISDPRLKIFDQANQGLAATLNFAIQQASGHFIARIDQDDLMHPDRLKLQLQFMKANSEVGLLGTWAEMIDEQGKSLHRYHRHPVSHAKLRFWFQFNNYFVHSSVMFRKSIFQKSGGYSTDPARQPEDYELWSRLLRITQGHNLPEILTYYRDTTAGMSRAGFSKFEKNLSLLGQENIRHLTQFPGESPAIQRYYLIGAEKTSPLSIGQLQEVFRFHWRALSACTSGNPIRFLAALFWSFPVSKRIILNLNFFTPLRQLKRILKQKLTGRES